MNKKQINLSLIGLALVIGATGAGWFWTADQVVPEIATPATVRNDVLPAPATWSATNNSLGSDHGLAENAEIDALWKRAKAAIGAPNSSDDAADQLLKLAQVKPQVLQQLIGLYGSETDGAAKALLGNLLSASDLPEVFELAKQLVTSKNAAQQSEGLAMLKNLSAKPEEKNAIVRNILAKQQNPGLLLQALAALKPPAPNEANATAVSAGGGNKVPDQAEIMATVKQLQALSQNADPAVRSQSLLQLAQWDKSGAGQTVLLSALTDHAPEVRQSAVFAIAQSGVQNEAQSNHAKTALFAVAGDTNESANIRNSALQVLESFTLNKTELANTAQLRAQLQPVR